MFDVEYAKYVKCFITYIDDFCCCRGAELSYKSMMFLKKAVSAADVFQESPKMTEFEYTLKQLMILQ